MAVLTRSAWLLGGLWAAFAPSVSAQLTQDEALALAFPDAEISRQTAFLDDDQLERARSLAGAGVDVTSTLVTYYVAHRGGSPIGVAYFDRARVRTLPQVLMVVVDPLGRTLRVETVSFREPPEYEAPERWLDLFDGRILDDDLSVRGAIPRLTGATLTARASTDAVRRVLALHAVLDPFATRR